MSKRADVRGRSPSSADCLSDGGTFIDLAPSIVRQRLVIEGLVTEPIGRGGIIRYLNGLSTELKTVTLQKPVTHRSERYGWAGWIHWESSGAHFYAWDDDLFFSVDIYTCKQFDVATATQYTSRSLAARRITFREF